MNGNNTNLILNIAIVILVAIMIIVYGKFLYKSTKHGYPSTMKRFFAFAYDMILINIFVIIGGVIYLIATGDLVEVFTSYTDRLNTATDSSYHPGVRTLKLDFFLFQCINVAVFSIYSMIFELLGGVTFGKSFMGIGYKYEHKWQPIVRNVARVAIFSTIPFYMNPTWSDASWWWPIWFFLLVSLTIPKRRWIHDLISLSTLENKEVR